MSALQLKAYELMGKLSDTKLQLIIEIMNNFLNTTDDSNNEVIKEKRPIGMFKSEKFLADENFTGYTYNFIGNEWRY